MKNLVIFIMCLFLISNCFNQTSNQKNDNTNILFKKLSKIEVDSFKNIGTEWRDSRLLLFRYHFKNDKNGEGLLLLLKRTNDNILRVKLQNKWINVDSIYNYFDINNIGLCKERIIYCFDKIDNFKISYTNNYINNDVLYIEIENVLFYYIYDYKKLRNFKLDENVKKISDNWWQKIEPH